MSGEGANHGLAGFLRGDTHVLPVRVYYEDTDFSGIVYHASYLRFLERGRTDNLRLAGVTQSLLHAGEDRLAFVVSRMTIDFIKAAHMDDVLGGGNAHHRRARGVHQPRAAHPPRRRGDPDG